MRGWLTLLLVCSVAHAQPAPPPEVPPAPPPTPAPTPAELAFQEGRALLEAGKFAEACAKFEASFKGDPDAPGTLLNLGLCNERLGRTATALAWFRKAQVRAAETGMVDHEDVAKQHTFSLAVRVPTIRIEFAHPPPRGASVFLDGAAVSELELAKIEVDPKAHVVELRAPNAAPIRTELTIKDGETKVVRIPVPPPPEPPEPPKPVVEIDRGKTQRRIAYALAGGGVLLWGGSLTLSLIGKREHDASERPEVWRRWQNITRFGGTSLFVAGTAAIAGAAYLYIRAPGVERVERTAVTPVVGSDQLGVAIHGAF